MAIRINFAGASILDPGSYSDVKIAQGSIASPSLGVVALIGESEEGIPYSQEPGLDAVTFGPDEFGAIEEKFGSGELVDAAQLAISPSNDPAILGGAQELLLLKTNASTFATTTLPQSASTYGTLKAKKSGLPGNNASVQVAIVLSKAIITISRLDTGVSEVSEPLGGNSLMTLQCTDAVSTAATVTITDKEFKTQVTGGTAQSLTVPLSSVPTVAQLVAFINAQPGYTASTASAQAGARPVSQLDRVTTANIKTAPYSILQDAFEVRDFFSRSGIVSFEPALFVGLPTAKPKTFLTGGSRGATPAARIQDCLDALFKRRVNFIVPLFSRDATADAVDSLTDPGSTYTVDAVHAAVQSHVNQASTVKGRKERQGWVGYKGTYANTAEKAAVLSSARVSLCFQDVDVLSATTGNVETKQPHMLAVIAAGMKAAAPVGTPNTFKQPNIFGFSHVDFDPETQSEKAIAANLTFVERDARQGGFRWKLDNSTYSKDLNAWVYNRPSVLYAADTAAYAVRINTEVFVGQRNSDVSEQSVINLLIGVFDSLKSAGIIVGDTNTGGRGYKDLKVRIRGSIVEIDVTLALVEGLEFILNTIRVQRAG